MYSIYSKDNFLIKKWKYIQNEYLANKIETMEPKINANCPETFAKSFREKSKKRKAYENEIQNYEKKKNNFILFQKLSNIYTKPSNRYNTKPYTVELEKNNKNFLKTNTRKWEIFKITRDNDMMQKRLDRTKSNFNKKEDKLSAFRNLSPENEKFNHTDDNFNKRANSIGNKKTEEKIHYDNDIKSKKKLYKRLAFINGLGLTQIEFITEGNCFLILIDPLSLFQDKIFSVSFECLDDVLAMRKAFKTYEQIINNLIFDGQSVILNTTKNLVYRSKVSSKNL